MEDKSDVVVKGEGEPDCQVQVNDMGRVGVCPRIDAEAGVEESDEQGGGLSPHRQEQLRTPILPVLPVPLLQLPPLDKPYQEPLPPFEDAFEDLFFF